MRVLLKYVLFLVSVNDVAKITTPVWAFVQAVRGTVELASFELPLV